MLFDLSLFVLAFTGIWVGSGVAIKAIEKIAHGLKISSFAVSFLLLGFFTSLGEFSVGVNSLINRDPEIFVGNLIGATIVLFMLVIPLLAIVGKKIRIAPNLQGKKMLVPLLVSALPVLLSLDGEVTFFDGLISLIIYTISVIFIQTKQGLVEKAGKIFQHKKFSLRKETLKIFAGVLVVFFASSLIVQETMALSESLNLSPFLISLLFVAIGTNMPEISFVFRSVFMKDTQVAFGDYLGSASINTAFFGVFSLWYGRSIYLTNSFLISMGFLIVGLIMFFVFARSKHTISRTEGLALLGLYSLFVFCEYLSHLH